MKEQEHNQVSNEKKPGWLGYIGDYIAQLSGDYKKKHCKGSLLNNQYSYFIFHVPGFLSWLK